MIIFALLQWNDLDGQLWICIYLATALLALLIYNNICLPCIIAWASLLVIFSGYMLIGLVPTLVDFIDANAYTEIFFGMSDDKPYIEQAREILGLLIILIYSIGNLIHIYLKRRRTSYQ